MRLFVVLSPLLSGMKPGDLVTGDVLCRGAVDDKGLDRTVEGGWVAEVFFESPPTSDVVDVVDEHPSRDASRDDWAVYAQARGIAVDDLDRDSIIELFLSDDEYDD